MFREGRRKKYVARGNQEGGGAAGRGDRLREEERVRGK